MTEENNKAEETLAPVLNFEEFKAKKGVSNVEEALRLNRLLTQGIAMTDGKVHYWAYYVLEKLKKFVKAYDSAIKKHKDYIEFNAPENKSMSDAEAKKKFPEYIDYFESLKELSVDVEIRPFMAEWAKDNRPAPAITAALIEFGLLDDLAKLEKWIFEKESKKAEKE